MLSTAWAEIRHHPSRLVATGLAVVISVGFIVACLAFVATESQSIGRRLTAQTSTSDVVARIEADPGRVTENRVRELPGVAEVAATYSTYADFSTAAGVGQLAVESLPDPPFRWSTLKDGHWPHGTEEIAVGAVAARSHGLALGSVLTIADITQEQAKAMTVVGILAEGRSLLVGAPANSVVDPAYFADQPDGGAAPTLLITADRGVDAETVADRVRRALPADTYVETSAAVTAETLAQMTKGTDVFRYLLLVFGAVALLVGAMIIINTFTIIIAQRRRQFGLLRAVGASTAQLRRSLVAEATIIGVVGSALGVALGLAIAAAAAGVSGSLTDGFVAPTGQVAGAFAAGVVLTWLAALVPARRATRVAPLEALRPVVGEPDRRLATRRRALAGGPVVLLGAAGIAVALLAPRYNVVLAVAASAVLAIGILVSAPIFLPAVLRLLARGAGRLGVTSRLASLNLVRNPARAAATCTALMLGVGMIVTLQVGAASMKSTLNDNLNVEFPVDVMLSTGGGPISPSVSAALGQVDGIRAVIGVREIEAGLASSSDPKSVIGVAGLRPDAGAVVRGGLDQLVDGVALAHPFTQEMLGVARARSSRCAIAANGGPSPSRAATSPTPAWSWSPTGSSTPWHRPPRCPRSGPPPPTANRRLR